MSQKPALLCSYAPGINRTPFIVFLFKLPRFHVPCSILAFYIFST